MLRGGGGEARGIKTPRAIGKKGKRAAEVGGAGLSLVGEAPGLTGARELQGVCIPGDGVELYPADTAALSAQLHEEEGPVAGQREVPRWVELFCPGHETYKYYKDGHYTGEGYDRNTSVHWGKLANLYAPHFVGVPKIFTELDEDLEGTLDYTLTRDRPQTTLDEQLKRTFWKPAGVGAEPRSMWRDGLTEVSEDDEDRQAFEEARAEMMADQRRNAREGGDFEVPKQSRWLLPLVVAAVDRLRREYSPMFKLHEAVQPPHLHPSKVILDLIQCRWLLSQTSCDADDIYDFLITTNRELSRWSDHQWMADEVPEEVLAAARKHEFFLGCTDSWLSVKRRGSLETSGVKVDGNADVEGYARVSGNVPMTVWQRERDDVSEEGGEDTGSTRSRGEDWDTGGAGASAEEGGAGGGMEGWADENGSQEEDGGK